MESQVKAKSKARAPQNRTLTCSEEECEALASRLLKLVAPASVEAVTNQILNQDFEEAAICLPQGFVDLLIVDPPYNLSKNYDGTRFRQKSASEYQEWFRQRMELMRPMLAPTASVYVCADWKTSVLVAPVLEELFIIRNRITWEREKGRGAKSNWKNNTEDIWFCTLADEYVFNVDAVKLKRKVVAPYRDQEGRPKDWEEAEEGNYRLTHPSNIWTDITVPFWSMPENTDHPAQKPEKLVAKLILASSNVGDFVFDPFLGSGTTAVAAKKLGRRYCGVEQETRYCCWAQKRLLQAENEREIQGYVEGQFWDRNSLRSQNPKKDLPGQSQGCNKPE